jgi:arylsulfatase A-like enzyme
MASHVVKGLAAALVLGSLVQVASGQERPNIVFMLSDDQAWYGLSVQMHPEMPNSKSDFHRTPRLEELAAQGMRFSAAYSPSTVCAPTRASLQTGKSPAQNQWTKAAPILTAADNPRLIPPPDPDRNLPEEEVTIGELLQDAGYATAHYGKWHLSGGGPGDHGYDEHDGDTSNGDAAPFNNADNPGDVVGMSNRALDFMAESRDAGKPFFVQISYYPLHYPENASPDRVAYYQNREPGRIHNNVQRAAITEDLDMGVGIVMDGLDRLGLSDNTYLIYMGDNGANGPAGAPIARGKGTVSEGGIRAPFIIRGPGIEPNSFSDVRMVGFDLFPTFAEWAGVEDLPENIEGGSIVSVLENEGVGEIDRPREQLVFHFPHYQSAGGPQTAILLGDMKLIRYYETGETRLYNLRDDIGETTDLSRELPHKTAELETRMDEHLTAIGAQLPTVNAHYDPGLPTSSGMGGGMGGAMGMGMGQ